MKKVQVNFYGKSPFEDAPRWHKLATYDIATAYDLIFDPDTFRIVGTTQLCMVDLETGEILEEVYLPI